MHHSLKEALYQFLSAFLSEHKRTLFDEVIRRRTRYITVVLEDIFLAQNASTIVRNCDCFGIQDLHVIDRKNIFDVRRGVAFGAEKWLTLAHYNQPETNNTAVCFDALRASGYRIYAASPHQNDVLISELPLDRKAALVFSAEKAGFSAYARQHVDGFVKVPMYGFSESLNVSVSAALSLYEITRRLHSSTIGWQLSPEEQLDLKLEWTRRTVRNADLLEKKFRDSRGMEG